MARLTTSPLAFALSVRPVAWDDGLDIDANHTAAARALAKSLGWVGWFVGGGLPDGTGNAYVRTVHNLTESDNTFRL